MADREEEKVQEKSPSEGNEDIPPPKDAPVTPSSSPAVSSNPANQPLQQQQQQQQQLVRLQRSDDPDATVSSSLLVLPSALSPSTQRMVITGAKAGVAIADGILLSNSAINPVITAALVVYQSVQAVQDYRNGTLNALGYQTTRGDVALRIGKEVACAGIGVGIGQVVGAVLGLTTLPIGGQIIATTIVSVGLGILVGSLFTVYVDRVVTRIQIRNQYGYPADEFGSQRHFEAMIHQLQDLSGIEACRVVQHYMDYRVACGWERQSDEEEYRLSGGSPVLLPVSLQHFTAVKLERKWGFLNQRVPCRKLFRALMLQHHPDRGGDEAVAAQLSSEFELYAFCRGWWGSCRSMLGGEGRSSPGSSSVRPSPHRGGSIWSFFNSLFPSSVPNSEMRARGLQMQRATPLVSSSPVKPQAPRKANPAGESDEHDLLLEEGDDHLAGLNSSSPAWRNPYEDDSDDDDRGNADGGEDSDDVMAQRYDTLTPAQQSAAVSRVLSGLHARYQQTVEMVNYTAIRRASMKKDVWARLLSHAETYNRMQSILHCSSDGAGHSSPLTFPVHWGDDEEHHTLESIVAARELSRRCLVDLIFSKDIQNILIHGLHLWQTGKDLVFNYLRSNERGTDGNTARVIDTLLLIQSQLEAILPATALDGSPEAASSDAADDPERCMEMKVVGLSASSALGGDHAKVVRDGIENYCRTYLASWTKKQHTYVALQRELALAKEMLEVPGVRQNRKDLVESAESYGSHLFIIQQQLAEVDSHFEELRLICTSHLPEFRNTLSRLQSTVVWGVTKEMRSLPTISRDIGYERERHLSSYVLESEPDNSLDPFLSGSHSVELEGLLIGSVRCQLLRGTYVHPLSAITSSCWIKQYDLSQVDVFDCNGKKASGGRKEEDLKSRGRQLAAQFLLQRELEVSKRCRNSSVCPSEVFSDSENCTINFHIPRGSTQQRFRSVRSVQSHICSLGLKWLYDALQCVIDLHMSSVAHGSIRLSNFTYDSFGCVSLGDFGSQWRTQSRHARTFENDTTDFGIMVLSEILPYFFQGSTDDPPSPSGPEAEIALVYKEIGERLVAKVEPPFQLPDARSFLRRILQATVGASIEFHDPLSSQKILCPGYWGGVSFDHTHLHPQLQLRFLADGKQPRSIFRNVNPPLWERYCKYRVVLNRTSCAPLPPSISKSPQFLLCSDDLEVNERFAWLPCQSEAEAWKFCYHGIDRHKLFSIVNPLDSRFGSDHCGLFLVFRAALGTVKTTYSPHHSQLHGDGKIQLVSPDACYPELVCFR